MKPGSTGDPPAACGANRLMKPQNMSAITQALRSRRRWNRTVRATSRKTSGIALIQSGSNVHAKLVRSQVCDSIKPIA